MGAYKLKINKLAFFIIYTMGYRRHRHHRKNKFRNNHFNFRNRQNYRDKRLSQESKSYNRPFEETKKPSPNFWSKITLRYKIFLGLLVLNIIAYLFFNFYFAFIIIADIIFVIIWMWGWTNNCPRCKSHWARKLVDRDYFGTHTEFENITRNISHRDANGNIIGSSSVRDTRPVTMHTIQNHWTCKYCGHFWSGRVHDVRG